MNTFGLVEVLFEKNKLDCFDDVRKNDMYTSVVRITSEEHFQLKNGIMEENSLSVSLANVRLNERVKKLIENIPSVAL